MPSSLDTGTRLLVRGYTAFTDHGGPDATSILAPVDAEQYADGRSLDLVVHNRSRAADIDGYTRFVRHVVRRFGASTSMLQIAEEPNVRGNAVLDGDYPDILRAIVAGVAAANDEARVCGFDHIRVGVNTTPLFGPSSGFYTELVALGGRSLVNGLAYIGLDMFPDVFRPVPGGDLRAATRGLLGYHRRDILRPPASGTCRSTSPSTAGQPAPNAHPIARRLSSVTIVETILDEHEELGIAAYELFSLRDADSSGASLFHRFGIMTDDYVPKPAFEAFKRLIARGPSVTTTALSSVARRAQVVGAVDRRPDVAMQRAVERHLLREEDGRQVIGGIHPEQRRRGAVPEELAHRAPVLLRLLRLRHAHREVHAEAHRSLAGQEIALRDARIQLVGRHQPHGGRLENSGAVEFAAVQQHARQAACSRPPWTPGRSRPPSAGCPGS